MSKIHVGYDTDRPSRWVLDRPYQRWTEIGPIVVPQGFETDLASTPYQVWRAVPRWGRWSGAAIVHDYLYRVKPPELMSALDPRLLADRIMLRLMYEDRVPHGIARVIYRMVRDFGHRAWGRWKGKTNA